MEHLAVEAVQIIHNALELDPGRELIDAARRTGSGSCACPALLRHARGQVHEGHGLRRERPPAAPAQARGWSSGLRKIEQLGFLTEERTLGQAAIKWLLAEPAVTTVLPNIYDSEQLREFAAAPATTDLSSSELERVADLYANGFYLEPAATGA